MNANSRECRQEGPKRKAADRRLEGMPTLPAGGARRGVAEDMHGKITCQINRSQFCQLGGVLDRHRFQEGANVSAMTPAGFRHQPHHLAEVELISLEDLFTI